MGDRIYDLQQRRALADTLEATAATADDAALGLIARTYLAMLTSVLRMDGVIDRGVIRDAEQERLLRALEAAPDGLAYEGLHPMKPDWAVMQALWGAKAIAGNSREFGRATRFRITEEGRRALDAKDTTGGGDA